MLNIFTDSFFWFTQPATALGKADKLFIYVFAALLAAAIMVRILIVITKHDISRRLLRKFWNLLLNVSLTGLVWGVFRYENTPVFAKRYWAALVFLTGLIWLGFIVKYLIKDFGKQKSEFDHEMLKRRYMPGSNR